MADLDQETIVQTQAMLGKVIKKPVLTDKLLRRPPFKFLHDIIINVSISSSLTQTQSLLFVPILSITCGTERK